MSEPELSAVTYEELAELEHEFDDLDAEILRKQYVMSASLYAKRQAITSKIPNFWPLVFEFAPPEIDAYIQPSDSEIFAKCLTGLEVKRFEVPLGPEKIEQGEEKGDPRSLQIRFEFAENEWFEDTVLEKKLWWRRAKDGWTGLVSEPTRVHWKEGKDLTQGLMNGAIELWEARQKAGDMSARNLPQFDALARILDNWSGANTSFFTWFAYVSSRRWVSAEESTEAIKAERERRRNVAEGNAHRDETSMPDEEPLEQQVEVHDDGDTLANVIAEDLWPGAIKYFTQAQEDVDASEADFEDDEDDDSDGISGDAPIDIRQLVEAASNPPPLQRQPRKRQRHA